MTDLRRQAKILYYLYESFNKNEVPTHTSLKRMDDLVYIPDEEFKAELVYLIKSGYVERMSPQQLNLSDKGVRAIELLFKKFIIYVKKAYAKELSYWIKIFDYSKSETSKLISQVYFRIQHQPEIRNAFGEYLDSLGRLENVETYEVKFGDMGTLIDDIFFKIVEVNRLFEYRFKCKLFCPPLSSQSTLNKATKAKTINFLEVVATVGLMVNEICHQDIDKLLSSQQKGSVNKIKALLDENSINYDVNTINRLKALNTIRNTTFPIHEAGPEIINSLKKLDISFPADEYNDAINKILQAFDLCLIEMRQWFVS
jgi:hypothetical protein